MLKNDWPRSAWYALPPPTLLLMLGFVLQTDSTDTVDLMLLMAPGSALALLFKGATVAFYLRRAPVDYNGAAFEEGPPPDASRLLEGAEPELHAVTYG